MKRAIVVTVVLAIGAARAAAAGDEVLKATFNPGLGGKFRPDGCFPVVVELEALEAPMTVDIVVDTDTSALSAPRYRMTREIVPGTVYRAFLYPHCTHGGDSYTAAVLDTSGNLLREEKLTMRPFREQCYVVGILDAAGVNGISLRSAGNGAAGLEPALVPSEYMPTRAAGYAPADALLWVHPDPSRLPWPSQADAIRQWVLGGGRLIVATGQDWQGAAGSFLAQLLPGDAAGSTEISDLEALEEWGGRKFQAARSMIVTRIGNVRGKVLLRSGGLPLAVSRRVGFGEVIWLAWDPTKSPFAGWRGGAAFWDRLLGLRLPREAEKKAQFPAPTSLTASRQWQYYDNDSVAAALSGNLSDFPKVRPVSFAFVVAFLVFYVVLIGPVDYFVLKRLKHLEWTWFTFPAVAVAATLVAFWVISASRAVQLYVNQFSVVDWSADGKAERTFSYATVLSPRNHRYDVSFRQPGAGMALVGGPGHASRSGLGLTERFTMVERADWGTSAEELFIPVWSSRTFAGEWLEEDPPLPPLDADLAVAGGVLRGTVENTGEKPVRNLTFVHSSGIYRLGGIEPGEVRDISVRRSARLKDAIGVARGRAIFSTRARRELVADVAFVAGAMPVVRYRPAEVWREYIDEDYEAEQPYLTYDLPAEFSLRSLVDDGQGILTGMSQGVDQPLSVGIEGAERWEYTLYRICVNAGF